MTMEAVVTVTGTAVPLDRSDVDTDQIMPSVWLKRVERTGFGEGLFSDWRRDPDFVLNRPEHVGATILVTGANFGTGSSREHAVWGLLDHGFKVVVSPGFADIFRNNCTKAGLLPVVVGADVGRALLDAVQADPSLEITVDVADRTLITSTLASGAPGIATTFPLDDFTQWRFLEGLDDIGITLRHEEEITAFEAGRPSRLPVTR
jgi:3-isopropylmalate/(R)-2-methylmalate dehydratase small subunit